MLGGVLLGYDPRLEGPPRGKRLEHKVRVSLKHNALGSVASLLQRLAVHTVHAVVVVSARLLDLLADIGGGNGRGNDLGVGMR